MNNHDISHAKDKGKGVNVIQASWSKVKRPTMSNNQNEFAKLQ
jgi:hypothetical protein